jgi:hypothetical protein
MIRSLATGGRRCSFFLRHRHRDLPTCLPSTIPNHEPSAATQFAIRYNHIELRLSSLATAVMRSRRAISHGTLPSVSFQPILRQVVYPTRQPTYNRKSKGMDREREREPDMFALIADR